MMRSLLAVTLTCLAACDLSPLTRDQLFGPRDAAAPPDAAEVEPAPDALSPPPACAPRSQDGLFSGAVVDDCDGLPLDASVGIGGQHACTFAAKGSFQFRNLPVGCNLTVTATAAGYASHQATVLIPPRGTAGHIIRLQRLGDDLCQGPTPPAPTCRCDQPGCITP
jgi:hypothetical protein